jgi:hypothetical protein
MLVDCMSTTDLCHTRRRLPGSLCLFFRWCLAALHVLGGMQIFGATEDDIAQLKIVSIQEVDLDVLDSMVGKHDEA